MSPARARLLNTAPHFWSAEKNGKTVYLLGTIHMGVSLKDLTCSDKIFESLKTSDLVFLEIEKLSETLSENDKKIVLTGSLEEREEILKRLSQEDRKKIENTKNLILKGVIPSLFPYQFVDEERESPENLSRAIKEFLTDRGITLQENFADIAYSLSLTAYYDAFFSFPDQMDVQIGRIAQEENIRISTLDDKSATVRELNENKTADLKKPLLEINSDFIEESVRTYNQSVEFLKADFKDSISFYLKGPSTEALKNLPEHLNDNDIETTLLKNRNALWLEKLLKALENQDYGQIFLAGHFTASANLLDMLKAEGFSVRPVTCPEIGIPLIPVLFDENSRVAPLFQKKPLFQRTKTKIWRDGSFVLYFL